MTRKSLLSGRREGDRSECWCQRDVTESMAPRQRRYLAVCTIRARKWLFCESVASSRISSFQAFAGSSDFANLKPNQSSASEYPASGDGNRSSICPNLVVVDIDLRSVCSTSRSCLAVRLRARFRRPEPLKNFTGLDGRATRGEVLSAESRADFQKFYGT